MGTPAPRYYPEKDFDALLQRLEVVHDVFQPEEIEFLYAHRHFIHDAQARVRRHRGQLCLIWVAANAVRMQFADKDWLTNRENNAG